MPVPSGRRPCVRAVEHAAWPRIIPARMRILLVTQMWPSPENPDLGSFLVPLARELEEMGNEVDVAAISRRGGSPSKYLRLSHEARDMARSLRPDVVFAHFL